LEEAGEDFLIAEIIGAAVGGEDGGVHCLLNLKV
jgi:hypothetical protein